MTAPRRGLDGFDAFGAGDDFAAGGDFVARAVLEAAPGAAAGFAAGLDSRDSAALAPPCAEVGIEVDANSAAASGSVNTDSLNITIPPKNDVSIPAAPWRQKSIFTATQRAKARMPFRRGRIGEDVPGRR